jgi:ABC-2 type transport system permease protein
VKALAISGVALLRLLRDRSNIFFVFILPIGIIIIVGAQFGGGFNPSFGVVLEPGAGELGESLARSFEEREDITVVRYDSSASVVTAVERGTMQAAVVIPSGYDERIRGGETVEVGFFARPDGAAYQTIILAEVAEQSTLVRAALFAVEEQDVTFDEAIVVAATVEPGVEGVSVDMRTVGESVLPIGLGQFDLGASSQLILFMYLTGLTGSAALIETRRLGVASRMLSTPTTAGTVVAGEGLGRFSVVMLQGLYILFATLLLFQVNWGDPVGAAAIMILFGAVAAGTAMLMGTLFRNDQQAAGVGVILGLGVAALGGCMIPIEFFSPTMQKVAHLTPHAWALDAFSILVRENGTIIDILPELAVLALFAVALITIASFRLRRAMTTI